jgi:predicted RNase H-like nuclease
MAITTTFIGVDLAWKSEGNHSGIVVARGDARGATMEAYSVGVSSLEAVQEYILSHSSPHIVVAIDAPLIIANETGQRPCERLVSQLFGGRHAGAHTSNLGLYPNAGSARLAQVLQEAGFSHNVCPASDYQREGRWMFEVYPHPAQVNLFNLERIIKYKRGRVGKRRSEFRRLQHFLKDLSRADPPFKARADEGLLNTNVEQLHGRALKRYEDVLDAYFCAYLALFYWRWGGQKNEMIGDMDTGYIVVPTARVE